MQGFLDEVNRFISVISQLVALVLCLSIQVCLEGKFQDKYIQCMFGQWLSHRPLAGVNLREGDTSGKALSRFFTLDSHPSQAESYAPEDLGHIEQLNKSNL